VCVENQLIGVIIDFFIAGAETTSGSIGFALLYLLHNPDIQRQIQTELDQVCGDSLPQLAHRPRCDYNRINRLHNNAPLRNFLLLCITSLPYTEAALMEAQRLSNITPLAVAHKALRDTQLGGYSIPRVL
jgi:methyl farnesoate epoxidase/farnesoate epoxidase